MIHHGIIKNPYLHFINTLWYLNSNINIVIKKQYCFTVFETPKQTTELIPSQTALIFLIMMSQSTTYVISHDVYSFLSENDAKLC